MISVSCATPDHLQLRKAMMFYGNSANPLGFVSLHDVEHTSLGPIIGAGKPASKSAVRAILKDLSRRSKKGEVSFIPQHILSQGENHLIWYVAPQHRQLWFRCEALGGEVTGVVPNPGLVFAVTPQGWHVYAVKGDGRPVPETELFVSPYLNVWMGGKICTGNVTTPKGNDRWNTVAWEDAFFRSYFTHINIQGKGKLVNYRGGAYAFWRQLLARPPKRFPEDRLVSYRSTLGDLFASLSKGGN